MTFASEAHLHLHPVDASKLQWQVETEENYRRGTPQLYRLDRVADAGRANWGALATLTDAGLSHGVTPAMVQAEAERLAKTRPGDIAAIGYVLRLALSTAPDAHLQDAAREAFEAIGGIPLEDTGLRSPISRSLRWRAIAHRACAHFSPEPCFGSKTSPGSSPLAPAQGPANSSSHRSGTSSPILRSPATPTSGPSCSACPRPSGRSARAALAASPSTASVGL